MKTFQQIGTDTGALVQEKNRAYGSSFQTVGKAMHLLYPRGISPAQMDDALLLTRIWDKMMRIATDRDALGESPYGDIAGYGILGVSMHQRTTDKEDGQDTCGTAKDAVTPSGERGSSKAAGSAANDAKTPLTTSRKKRSGQSSRRQSRSRSVSTSGSVAAPASTATEVVSPLAVGRGRSQRKGSR